MALNEYVCLLTNGSASISNPRVAGVDHNPVPVDRVALGHVSCTAHVMT